MVTQAGRVSGAPSEFADDVLEVVDTIPEGMVMTYGDIAELLGRGGARGVGNVMARYGSDVPWWRVIRVGWLLPAGARGRGARALPRGGHAAGPRPGRRPSGRPRPGALARGQVPVPPLTEAAARAARTLGLHRTEPVSREPRRCPSARRSALVPGGRAAGVGRGWWDERVLNLRRAPSVVAEAPPLDDVQLAALAHRGGVLRVLGGPGTGKTTTAIEAVVARVESGEADARPVPHPHLVARRGRQPARAGHGPARRHLDRAAGPHPPGPRVRHPAPGGGPARRPHAAAAQRPRAGRHPARAAGRARRRRAPGRDWPERVHLALGTRGFRGELRDLLMRAVEHDLEPADLARLGREHDRPEWVAAADVLAEYDEVTALSAPGAYDPAWILGAAADLLEEDPAALGAAASTGCGSSSSTTPRSSPRPPPGCCARSPRPGWTSSCSATPTVPCRPSVAPTRATSATAGPSWTGARTGTDPVSRGGEPRTLVLPTAYRLPQAVVDAAGAGRAQDRRARRRACSAAPAAGRAGGQVDVRLLRAVSQEASHVAAELREAHLRFGIPWSRDGRHRARPGAHRDAAPGADGRRGAGGRDAPPTCRCATRWRCVRCSPCSRWCSSVARGADEPLSRRRSPSTPCCRRSGAPTRSGCAGCGARCAGSSSRAAAGRTSDELLAEALLAPGALVELGPEALPRATAWRATIAAGVKAARGVVDGRPDRPGLALGARCQRRVGALGDVGGHRAGRRVAGDRARRWARRGAGPTATSTPWSGCSTRRPSSSTGCRRPGPRSSSRTSAARTSPATPSWRARRSASRSTVTTPQAAAGRQWQLVVVAGVQEGVWPDLRLRGSLLGSEHLVDVVSGRAGDLPGRPGRGALRRDPVVPRRPDPGERPRAS